MMLLFFFPLLNPLHFVKFIICQLNCVWVFFNGGLHTVYAPVLSMVKNVTNSILSLVTSVNILYVNNMVLHS